MELKIMTYNVASGRCYMQDCHIDAQGRSVVDLSQCARVIREQAPDICGINEINSYFPEYLTGQGITGTPADQTGFLAEETGLGNGYFGKAIHFQGRGDYGNSVLSRFPILQADVIPIPDPEVYDENRYYETRGITRVKLENGITVLQVHVGLAVAESQNAVVTLCDVIRATEGPLILMGDFNMCPGNFLLDRIRELMQEVTPVGEGYIHTFPSWDASANIPDPMRQYPKCKIDYIFVSRHFRALDCRVHSTRASDHLPMTATLVLE